MLKCNNVITLGCRLNFWESSKINNFIKESYRKDLVVFNTCSVTNEAIKNAKKHIRTFHKMNPKVKIAVTGCGVESDHDFFRNMKEVSYIIGNKEKLKESNWQKIQNTTIKKSSKNIIYKNIAKVNPSTSDVRKFVRIQNGCDHSCTFCIIPSCRGDSQSETVDNINKNIFFHLENGVKEIILTGVDLTSWTEGNITNNKLGDLLEKIFIKNTSDFRLRLSSIDAAEIDDKLLDLIKNEPRLMPHFHFSLQSLDDLILKRMKRRHNVRDIYQLFDKIRNVSKNVTFGADFICGFPTEDEKMFLNTYRRVKDLNITHLHVFPYSEKKGTPASRMPQVDLLLRRRRAKLLRKLGIENFTTEITKQINKEQNILVETDNGFGRTENNFKILVKNGKKGSLLIRTPKTAEYNYLIV